MSNPPPDEGHECSRGGPCQTVFQHAREIFAASERRRVLVTLRWRCTCGIAEYETTAAKLGAAYAYDPPAELLPKIQGFDLTFADGASLPRAVRDVLTLEDARRKVYVFLHEHRGSLPGRAAGGAHRETVGCVVSPLLRLPRFRLSPERPVEKIASLLGLRDLDFPSHPGFSRLYYLNADDEAAARVLFASKVLNFFENCPGWQVEGRGDTLLIYRFRKAAGPDEVPAFLEMVEAVRGLFSALA